MLSIKVLKLFRLVAFVLALCGGLGILYWTVVWYQYYDRLPRSPQPATGRVYVMNMHGVAVYATYRERHHVHVIEDTSYVLLVAGIVGSVLTDPDYWRKMGWRYPGAPRGGPLSGGDGALSGKERDGPQQFH